MKKNTKIDTNIEETRQIEVREIELRASVDPTSRRISGTAVVFDELSDDLGGFKEMILSGAISQELLNKSDICMFFNHDQNTVPLARWRKGKGTLSITMDKKRIQFSFIAKKSGLSDEVYEAVKCGDLNACSFSFRKAPNGDSIQRQSDGSYIRKINTIDIFRDIDIVINPAYSATSVDTRSLDEFIANNPIPEENNIDETNDNDMNDKLDQILALQNKIVEMLQAAAIEDALEDAAEAISEALEPIEPVASTDTTDTPTPADTSMNEDMVPPTPMEERSLQDDEDLKKYYEDLKLKIK